MVKKKIFTKKHRKSFRQYLVLLVLFVSVYLATTYLLEYKQGEEMLVYANSQMKKKPLPLSLNIEDKDNLVYKRVTMAGSYDYEKEFLIEVDKGYELIVPFKRASGAVIMVNRGYVSQESSKYITRPNGMIRIEGVIGIVDSYSSQYASVIKNVAEQAGVDEYSPYIVSLIENDFDNYPVGASVKVKTNNSKLIRSIILYLYSAFVLLLIFFRQKRFIRADF